MLGRYALESEKGTLLFEISKEQVQVEIIELGMKMNPSEAIFKEEEIILKSSFFMFPHIIHETRLKWKGDCYKVEGSYAMFGKTEGNVVPFLGKTKYEVMLDELLDYKTGKVVYRSDDEINSEVTKLLSQMTLQEKIGQMSQGTGRNVTAIGHSGEEIITETEAISRGMVGSVIAMTGPGIIFEQQKNAVNNSRLGIPLMFCQDVIHGYETIFPIPLAWSCSFNPKLLKKAMSVAAKEATSQGIMYGFSPMLDIGRDPRWGRVSECNGEDPYLASIMCEAHVRGFQGNDLYASDTMLACMKHFVGYSAAEGGRDYNTAEITDSTLYNVYTRPFQAGIHAGAASVMNAFNVLNGIPVVANKDICNKLLREKMGFDGILISDFASVDEVIVHGAAEDGMEAAVKAANASLDIEMGISNYYCYLETAVNDGLISEKLIDDSVHRILTYKYKTGLMDDPFKYLQPDKSDILCCEEHLQVSYELAKESVVLLKNDGILPLKKDKKVALMGPIGDSTDLFGPWQFSKREKETTTIKEALIEAGYEVEYERGSGIDVAIEGGIEKAVQIAQKADVILLSFGETKIMSGEAASRLNMTIPESQLALAKVLKALNKPIVLLLTNGRPLILDWMDEHMNGIIETWFLGSMAGKVIADVLEGVVNPSGKLSMTFPKHPGQIPVYYNHLNTGRPYRKGDPNKFVSKYIDGPNEPLYPFGYGLSYTSFKLGDIELDKCHMSMDGNVHISVRVRNTGQYEGTEVVQLYCRDVAAGISRPVKELIGFERVSLLPGESKKVTFNINRELLAYYDHHYNKVLEPGKINLYIGTSSKDDDLSVKELMVTT